jgi:dimethylhistidine N-methyltransferase
VREYLQRSPRQLPSKYFYDPLGSALFDAICRLPWYRITRAESAMLARYAGPMLAPLRAPFGLVELGCGNGDKLALLLEHAGRPCERVHLVDISASALERARDRITGLVPGSIRSWLGTYEDALAQIAASRPRDESVMVLFLGSNIGNFDPGPARDLLSIIRRALAPGDGLLLGTDLVKSERELLLAYDDPLRVTAAFNLNLLRRINDELQATFDLGAFTHQAIWNRRDERVEMRLVSRRGQQVRIAACDLTVAFDAGEWIWTESSYKYDADAVVARGLEVGFTRADQWIDEDARFAVTRFTV